MALASFVVSSVRSRRFLLVSFTGLWLLALVPGVRYLVKYESTAGRQGVAPSYWENKSISAGDSKFPTLLVALHPRCSCSDATLSELEEATQGLHHPYNAVLLIDEPRGAAFDWQKIQSYREAQKALNARVILDDDGRQAAQFGAFTSGEVLLYSAEDSASRRTLLFAGGVTGSRGMTGENKGVELLRTAFENPQRNVHATSEVYGCGLLNATYNSASR